MITAKSNSAVAWLAAITVALLAGCSNSNDDEVVGGPAGDPAIISGTITYDSVTHSQQGNLDYNSIVSKPVRGATVQLVDNGGSVLDVTQSDDNGNYQLDTNVNLAVRVRVLAEANQTGSPAWDISVVDNTNSGALYSMQGAVAVVAATAETRDLHASSGWGGSSYSGTRVSAPFAILDNAYTAAQLVVAVDNTVQLPPLTLNWSRNNVPTPGDVSVGQITTSYYSNGNIYILGAENVDTDEFDAHVVVHEWGHYFEDRLARADSIGGSHSGGQRLDPRVAFGEGWGNAWSAMALDDPLYRDSLGNQQGSGFAIDIEANAQTNAGWYNEGSVQSILYDLFDANDDGNDNLTMGFAPIYQVLTGEQSNTEAFTTLFSFIYYLRQENVADQAAIDAIVSGQNTVSSSIDIYGSSETNNAGNATTVLPIYTAMVPGATPQLCSNNSFAVSGDEYNKLGARRYIALTISQAGAYNFSMVSTNNSGDPDLYVYRRGVRLNCDGTSDGCSSGVGSESFSLSLAAGEYVIDAHDYLNVDSEAGGGLNCFNISVTPL